MKILFWADHVEINPKDIGHCLVTLDEPRLAESASNLVDIFYDEIIAELKKDLKTTLTALGVEEEE